MVWYTERELVRAGIGLRGNNMLTSEMVSRSVGRTGNGDAATLPPPLFKYLFNGAGGHR